MPLMTHNVLFADKPRYRTRGDSANSTLVIRASTIIALGVAVDEVPAGRGIAQAPGTFFVDTKIPTLL